ncbi:MAG: YitT family protein [Lachnospiraceae bacterium]|nr:YitT family protein [Lachnospiraceae bacterium]
MNKKTISFWRTFGYEILGNFLIALGIYNFAVASSFPLTGFSGVAVIIYRFFQLPIGAVTFVLNIPVALICWRILGNRFMLRTLRCMVTSTLLLDLVMPLLPTFEGSRMLSAICSGALQGVGYGLIYKAGSSTGGLDFITLSLKSKKPHLSLGGINFVLDFLVVTFGGLLFDDVEGIIYGIIINYLLAIFIDKIMFGANAGKMMLIITEKGREVVELIEKIIDRGATIIPAQGGWKNDPKSIIMCACSPKQVYQMQEKLKELDPASFTVILDSSEVHGQGFKVTTVGKTEDQL